MNEACVCGMTVLAIDEEAEVLTRIAGILEGAGHACQCVSNVDNAQEATTRSQPDLIIANVNLAGRSGSAICEQLKAEAGILDVPVLFLSAAQVPDVVRRSGPGGLGVYYLRKPFNAGVLVQLVEKSRRLNPLRPGLSIPGATSRKLDAPKSASPRVVSARESVLVAK
jgi:DNA-binding response OmpR family regulator